MLKKFKKKRLKVLIQVTIQHIYINLHKKGIKTLTLLSLRVGHFCLRQI